MSTPTHQITTAEELLNAPSDLGPCELVRGELVMISPGKGRHGVVSARILGELIAFVRKNDLGEVLGSSTGYVLSRDPDTVREPDVSFVSAQRFKGQDLDAFLDGAPDLAVEVLSPSNTAAEMRAKMDDYFGAGCRVMWIVDPLRRSVVVHCPDGSSKVLTEDDTLTEEELLPGFSMVVREAFPSC